MRLAPPTRARALAALALLAASACGGGRKPPPPPPAPAASSQVGAQVSVTGEVAIVGSTPFEKVMVLPEDPRVAGVEVVGELRDEVRAAGGARLAVEGEIVSPGRMCVARYWILSVNGMTPLTGVLETWDGALYLRVDEPRRAVRLDPAPEGLQGRAGAKVWVVLGDDGAVKAYGILREPGS